MSWKGSQFLVRPFRTVRGLRSTAEKNKLTFKMMWVMRVFLRGGGGGLDEK